MTEATLSLLVGVVLIVVGYLMRLSGIFKKLRRRQRDMEAEVRILTEILKQVDEKEDLDQSVPTSLPDVRRLK